MRALLIVCHPDPQSFCRSLANAAREGLEAAGHEVSVIDLYAEGYRAAMSPEERAAYHSEVPVLDPQVQAHIDLVRTADAMVFVYPTWWSGLPAMLKGWLERTMVPGVGFVFHPRTHRVQPGLRHVRHLVGVSTYGSPRAYVLAVNDNGRRTLMRTLRLSTGWRTRRTWLGLYAIDTSTAADRDAFVSKVRERMGRLR